MACVLKPVPDLELQMQAVLKCNTMSGMSAAEASRCVEEMRSLVDFLTHGPMVWMKEKADTETLWVLFGRVCFGLLVALVWALSVRG